MNIQRTEMSATTRIAMENAGDINKVATQISAGMISKANNGVGGDSYQAVDCKVDVNFVNVTDANGIEQTFIDVTVKMTVEQKQLFNGICNDVRGGNLQGASDKMSALVRDIHANGMPVDVNALVQQVLRESYVDTTADLQFYADKVQYFNDAKKQCREYVQQMRDYKTGMSSYMTDKGYCLSSPPSSSDKKAGSDVAGSALEDFNALVKQYISDNQIPRATSNDEETTKMINDIGLNDFNFADITNADNLDSMIESLEEKLNTLGDDSQLANTDLQNVLQKQQQTLQMMSNISKTLSDTALAVIRKIG